MTVLLRSFAFGLLLAASTAASALRAETVGPLAGRIWGTGDAVTVVLIHGDVSSGGPADYLYPMAELLAAAHPDARVVALLRPGYEDSDGRKSEGSNNGRRDHYTETNNDLLAAALKAARGASRRLVVMGHSGGSAQLGAVIGRHPGIVDSAILVSCPCDLRRWRKDRNRKVWSNSQSPSTYAEDVPATTRVIAITGARDDNTFAYLASDYVADLREAGVDASFTEVAGAGHRFDALSAAVAQAIAGEIAR
ncbi:S9 family peptidase [Zavarzinia compransoris]|uniref:alpha/beta hydrolase n=1 Tax=Zavarzinia marina TaxID=2911065 RepID=UPI001F4061F7|nr:alpha/beta fold hydrolase [Zavarzinia marina]MCF4165380.1 S9 family peptidase [Zavarzinia marina]